MNKEVDKAFIDFANEILNASKRELGTRRIGKNKTYGVATRTLQKSLTYSFKFGKYGVKSVQFYSKGKANNYAAFLHFGVNGTRKQRGAPFSYKNEKPVPSKAVLAWMRAKPVRLRDEKGSFIKQTPERMKQAAYAIGRGIKRNGIEGLFYFEKGYEYAYKKKQKALEGALGVAVQNELTARFEGVRIKLK
jgi:hypothetical protein